MMTMPNLKLVNKSIAGFTFIELILVMLIVGIVAASSSTFLLQAYRASNLAPDLVEADNATRVAAITMRRELQNIRSNTSTDISNAQTNTITFVDTSNNTITYSLSGTTITRNGFTFLEQVSALTFTYLDAQGAVTSTVSNIRYIQFSFTTTITTQSYSQTLGGTVFLMNSR